MDAAAIKFGFFDELNKIAAGSTPIPTKKKKKKRSKASTDQVADQPTNSVDAAPPPDLTPVQTPPPLPPLPDPMPASPGFSEAQPPVMDRIKDHLREHWPKYLAGAGAGAVGYGLYRKAAPGIRTAVKVLLPLGVGAYALGRGLKSGERDLERRRQADIVRSEAAQGRYVPFEA